MITISPGHYGAGTGARDIIDEVTEAIKVASKVTSLLRAANIVTNYFADTTSKTQSANIAWLIAQHNKTVRQLDVSIHFNKVGARTDKAFGTEVLYMGDANKALAERVSVAIAKVSGLKNRGAKKRTDLGLLRGTNKPCILIEVCSVESIADVELYKKHFDDICTAIARELAAYVGKSLVSPSPAVSAISDISSTVKVSDNVLKARQHIKQAVARGIFTDAHSNVDNYSDEQLLKYLNVYIDRLTK